MSDDRGWYNKDIFWETFEPMLFNQKRLADTASQVDDIINLLVLDPNSKILDIPCGIGRHSLEFARRGFKVTGVDRTVSYLEKATKRAAAEGLNVEFLNEDMRHFCRDNAFDVAINMFTSFGYFEEADDDRQVVENIYRSLKAGGKFLIELMSKELIGRDFRERDWNEVNGIIVLEDRQILNNWEQIRNRWIVLKDDIRIEHQFVLRLYSARELSMLLNESGFSDIKIYGSLTGIDYDHNAKRLVVVGHK